MMSLHKLTFRWSADFTLRQFVDKYKNHLPQLVNTTSGYSDISIVNDVAADQVCLFEEERLAIWVVIPALEA
jgi:predicted PolB exonuclease-like 3'-5' exonuclease